MSALLVLLTVILMLPVPTLLVASSVPVTRDTLELERLCFGAKYGKFLAAQKLPNLETLSCLQVVATFGNIEVCQNWQPQSFQEWKLLKISKIGNFQLAR